MAIVALINSETAADGLQYIGDIVGVFLDTHQFSPTELQKFNFLTINGSLEDVRARLRQITPRTEDCYLWQSDNKYHWTEPDGETILDRIQVFQIEGSNKWYKLTEDFKFPVNVDRLTPEEKQLLETVNINHASVDSFIRKLAKDITMLSGNNIEIKELKNSEP